MYDKDKIHKLQEEIAFRYEKNKLAKLKEVEQNAEGLNKLEEAGFLESLGYSPSVESPPVIALTTELLSNKKLSPILKGLYKAIGPVRVWEKNVHNKRKRHVRVVLSSLRYPNLFFSYIKRIKPEDKCQIKTVRHSYKSTQVVCNISNS